MSLGCRETGPGQAERAACAKGPLSQGISPSSGHRAETLSPASPGLGVCASQDTGLPGWEVGAASEKQQRAPLDSQSQLGKRVPRRSSLSGHHELPSVPSGERERHTQAKPTHLGSQGQTFTRDPGTVPPAGPPPVPASCCKPPRPLLPGREGVLISFPLIARTSEIHAECEPDVYVCPRQPGPPEGSWSEAAWTTLPIVWPIKDSDVLCPLPAAQQRPARSRAA